MQTITKREIKTIKKRYIDGAFVESHGREVMDSTHAINGKAVARVMLTIEPVNIAGLITPWDANSFFLSAMDQEPVLEIPVID